MIKLYNENKKSSIDNITYTCCKNKNYPFVINISESVASFNRIFFLPKMKVLFLQLAIISLIILMFSIISFAQSPNLGTSVNFAVFTTKGALNNTGTSHIIGNIGTNEGDMSGIELPTIVDGNIQWLNLITAQCAIDVQAAYNELFLRTSTVVDHLPAFGSGEILFPGVYSIGEAGSVAGSLTLDAEGKPDAIFIFQFEGAFTAGSSSIISLINGASACNVFWIAEGAMSMEALSEMKGTFIANNGAISLGTGGKLEGRMLSTLGEASVNNVLITLPICLIPLPIDLLSFTGYCDKQYIVLQWSTVTETNNSYFTVERSSNGINWKIAGTVAGAGNSSSLLKYELTDIELYERTSFYRLKQTDLDGNYKYGSIICIDKCEDIEFGRLSVYPNPTQGKFELLFDGNTNEIKSIEIFNSQGQKVYSSIGFKSMIDLSNKVSGSYFMRVQQNLKIINLRIILLR